MELKEIYENEYETKGGNLSFNNDYFLFDSDDIELSFLQRTIEKNLSKYQLNEKNKIEAEVCYHDLMSIYDKTDFNDLMFPYLKHSLIPALSSLKDRLKNNAQKGYFLLLLFSNLSQNRKKLYSYYYNKIKDNSFGLPKTMETMINPEFIKSKHYKDLLEYLTNWYVKNEFIFFFLQFLNDFFEIQIDFDDSEFSLDKNYDFSLKTFMKKSFFKLSGYLLSKLSLFSKSFFLNRALSTVNYNHLLVLLLSSFTYGVSLKKFMVVDLKPFALIAGFFFHYIINNIANGLENQSNYIEIDRISEILAKLNKKVEKIRLNLFDLIKANISDMVETDEDNKSNIKTKIKNISMLLQKYLRNIENIDDYKTTDNDLEYNEEFIKNLMGNENSSGEWVLITLNLNNKK